MSARRNEPARARRRYELKEKLSLTSLPQNAECGCGKVTRKLSLSNHFGWVVLARSQIGDNLFPHVSHFYEYPDTMDKDFEKVTYVLYMDKGVVVDKKKEMKATQTGAEGEPQEVPERGHVREDVFVERVPIRVEEEEFEEREPSKERGRIEERLSRRKGKGKYLIHEFFFVPKEERSLSRSTRGTSPENSETSSGSRKSRRRRSRSSKQSSGESEVERKKGRRRYHKSRSRTTSSGSSKGKKKHGKTAVADRWQLRAPAGSDRVERTVISEKRDKGNFPGLQKSKPKTVECVKKSEYKPKCELGKHHPAPSGEDNEMFEEQNEKQKELYKGVSNLK